MSNSRVWKLGKSKEITFIVTKDCQLNCKYCYQVGKNTNERMSWDTAKNTIDYILSKEHDPLNDYESVVFSFIGGEPFIEIDLIDRICDYIKIQLYRRNHHWFNSYRFAITTNGINYDNSKVQRFIQKNLRHLSITLTIDGTQRKHDINRVWKPNKDGIERGSYLDVVRNIPLWLQQFPSAATKVTISSADLPYVCESVKHIFKLGIQSIFITCVNENVWKEGDDTILGKQLIELADYIIDNKLYDKLYCSFFDRSIGHPFDADSNWNWCGTGVTLAIDASGIFYPCTRFAKFSLRDKAPRTIGNVKTGINSNLLRPFESLRRDIQSSKECFECEVASGCAWCQAENYDSADSATIFQRSTAICKMHKARVAANNYYWDKLDDMLGNDKLLTSPIDSKCRLDKTIDKIEEVIVILSGDSTSFCTFSNNPFDKSLISMPLLLEIINKTQIEKIKLRVVYPIFKIPEEYKRILDSIKHSGISDIKANIKSDVIVINDWGDLNLVRDIDALYILKTTFKEFCDKIEDLRILLQSVVHLNIIFSDEETISKSDMPKYDKALHSLKELILEEWLHERKIKVNLITDRLFLTEMSNCNAGSKSVTLAPNGKFYICPAFYYENPEDDCGDIVDGIKIKNPLLYKLNHSTVCRDCKAYQCNRCIYLNKKKTLEVNTPSFEQCEKSRIELEVTKDFFRLWKQKTNYL